MVISWILSSLSTEIAETMLYYDTAKQIWDELEEQFEQFSGAKLYQVQDQLNQLVQGSDPISVYFTKLKRIWEELRNIRCLPPCSCGARQQLLKHEEDRKVIKLLMGLNDAYKTMRGNILMMSPMPSINGVYSLLIQEEKQREISSHTPLNMEASALAATRSLGNRQQFNSNNNSNNNFNRMLMQQGGSSAGNFRGQTQKNSQPHPVKRNNYFCTHCVMEGHSNERCFILHPELRNNNNKKRFAATSTFDTSQVSGGQEPKTSMANLAGASSSQEYNDILNGLSGFDLDPNNAHAMMSGFIHEQTLDPW
ncbi:uncharacterized protein LOC141622275 [Silene latifolia]|uniref:uncharacterized protein LOC141622275 n=1 Tax=Silene latifolia TaxID=37657 RepID=UPI003D76CDDF